MHFDNPYAKTGEMAMTLNKNLTTVTVKVDLLESTFVVLRTRSEELQL